MTDIFDYPILCRKCHNKMKKGSLVTEGIVLRAMVCDKCKESIVHPVDMEKFNKYKNLRNKQYFVKMRLVGNSYAVSIPKEIVAFMRQQEKVMDDMVRLCFEDFGRLSLKFNEQEHKEIENER